MLKIVQLNKYYAPHRGGVETVVQNIAEGLCDQTEMCVLVCSEERRGEDKTANGVHLHRSGTLCKVGPMPVSPVYLRDVRRALKDADAVLLHMPFPWGDLSLLLSGYRGKVFLWWHSDVVRQKKLLTLYKPLMHRTLRRADKIIVATQGHIDGSAFLPPYRGKCVVIPYAVEEDWYLAGKAALPRTGEHTFEFLFVGRMVYYKGCEVLLRAFAAMGDKTCRLRMVGQFTPLTDELRRLADKLGVAERVTFEDDLPDAALKDRFAACDVFVLPSIYRSEAFALVQLQALAFGKPIINTNLPSGVPLVSRNGETGITVEPNDVAALAAAMDTLAGDAELRARYSAAARVRIEDFRMGKMLDSLFDLWNNVCHDKGENLK